MKELHDHISVQYMGCTFLVTCFDFSTKLEKEKKQIAKDAGMIKTEVTGAEVSDPDINYFKIKFKFSIIAT